MPRLVLHRHVATCLPVTCVHAGVCVTQCMTVWMYRCVSMCTFECMWVCIYVIVCPYVSIYMSLLFVNVVKCVNVCGCICVSVTVCVWMCVCELPIYFVASGSPLLLSGRNSANVEEKWRGITEYAVELANKIPPFLIPPPRVGDAFLVLPFLDTLQSLARFTLLARRGNCHSL